jgi:hypothetical protein
MKLRLLLGCLLGLNATFVCNAFAQDGETSSFGWSCATQNQGRECPGTHPIKGNLTTRSGECIYHEESSPYYDRTTPEICFATEFDAELAGCRAPLR